MSEPITAEATIRAAILDVIDRGYQCKLANYPDRITECNLWHPWRFEFTVPETDEENQNRLAFVDAVIDRIRELQQQPDC